MNAHTHIVRQIISSATALAIIALASVPSVASAAGNARYELRPHCTGGNEQDNLFGGPMPDSDHFISITDGRCTSFEVRDPENLQTPILEPGESLDMDLVIHNPDRRPISRFRAWIAYDASALDGVEVTVNPAFPIPTPGENAFSAEEGFLKISGATAESISDEKIVVAHIRMRVAQPRFEGTPLTYFDLTGTTESHTGIFTTEGGAESNVLVENPGYLFVRFSADGGAASSTVSSLPISSASSMPAGAGETSSVSPDASASSAPSAPPSTAFPLLQVQGLRVTTEGSSVFLAWDALPSTELVGYNVYYGTTMGSYIQRRGVEKAATSISIRALPVGTTYYFAVRGVNAQGQETQFSQEVGVSVGNPRTSTSPLNANSLPTGTPGTNGSVAGETGISSVLLVFLTVSAIIGTTLAFRRQWAVSNA